MFRRSPSITTLFSLAALLPLLLSGVLFLALAIHTVNSSSEALGRQILHEAATRVDSNVAEYLSQTRRMSDLLAGLVSEGMLDPQDFSDWTQRFFVRLRTTPEIASICFTNQSLETLYLMRYPPSLELGRGTVEEGVPIMRSYVAQLDGTIEEVPRRRYEYDPRTRPWWILAQASPSPVWTPAYQWFATPQRRAESVFAIAYTRKIYNKQGEALGVLSVDATLQQIDEHLSETARSLGAFLMLTDTEGRVLGTGSAAKRSPSTVPSANPTTNPAITKMIETFNPVGEVEHGARLEFTPEGDYWVEHKSIEVGPNTRWTLTIAVADDDLLRDSKLAVRLIKIAGVLLLVGAGAIALALARSVTRPARRLAQFAQDVGAGAFDRRIALQTTREFETLSDALNQMAASLQERVSLLAQKDAAQEASMMKARLIAHVSHEFRTPLNAIIGYGEMIRDGARDAADLRTERDAGNILLASRHLLTLIENLLDLSRMEAGKARLGVTSFAVAHLVREVVDTVRPVVEQNRNQFEVHCALVDEQMTTDAPRVKQVLINLLGNAAKFTNGGRIDLSVELSPDEAVFEVRDTGPGMSSEQLKRLFEPFSQVHVNGGNAHDAGRGGAGLGLAISRQIAELLGGSLVIESELGRGTSAIFRLQRFHRESTADSVA